VILRDYQKQGAADGAALLFNYKIAYYCWEVRSGKTLTSLRCAELYGAKKVLFVTKKKAIGSINSDYDLLQPSFDLCVTNYEALHLLTNFNFDLIIIDEAHTTSAFPKPSVRTLQLKKLCEDKPIIYLSGTPTPESYSQWFHQLWISSYSPFLETNFYKWFKIYGIPKKKYLYNREIFDYSNTIDFNEKINHLILTKTQIEAGFESAINEHILSIKPPSVIEWAIGTLKKDKIINTKEGKVILADTAVKEMMKVHQITSGTIKCEDGSTIIISDYKAQFIKEKFKGKKIAIFYKYIAEAEMISKVFNVTQSIEEFNETDKVFISQIQSGREGINLSRADALIFFNIDFSAVSYWQGRSRLQSKERKKSDVYFIFAGIEHRIYEMVSKKKDYTLKHYMNKKLSF
jgi:SNF2 family DNA or RNA helicase